MITITATTEIKASLADALTAHLADDHLTLGLKRLRREDRPFTVLAMVPCGGPTLTASIGSHSRNMPRLYSPASTEERRRRY